MAVSLLRTSTAHLRGALRTITCEIVALRNGDAGESDSHRQRRRDRARRLHRVVGIELDLQAALPAIEEHARWPSAAASIATGTRFFCPNGEMPPT